MILLTGCAGYIGSHVSHVLDKKKIKHIGIDDLSRSSYANIKSKKLFFKGDYSSSALIKKIFLKYNIKTVIHCGAFAYVLDGEKQKKKYLYNNYIKSKIFFRLCSKKGIKNFIFLSSSNIYKDTNIKKSVEHKIKIDEIKNYYGKTKYLFEKYLLSEKNKLDNLIILRLFNIAGYLKSFKYYEKKNIRYLRIIPLIIKKIYERKKLNIFLIKDKKKIIYPKRDYLHIKDFIDLLIIILSKLNKSHIKKVYNVGIGKNYSIKQILDNFYKIFKSKINIKYKVIAKEELISTLSDISDTKKDFNWKPKKNIRDIINSSLSIKFK
jgi:UDP-glucose 4-epimerase